MTEQSLTSPPDCIAELQSFEEALEKADFWINQVAIRGDAYIACLDAQQVPERSSDGSQPIPEFIMKAVKHPVAVARLNSRIDSMRDCNLLNRLRRVIRKFGL